MSEIYEEKLAQGRTKESAMRSSVDDVLNHEGHVSDTLTKLRELTEIAAGEGLTDMYLDVVNIYLACYSDMRDLPPGQVQRNVNLAAAARLGGLSLSEELN